MISSDPENLAYNRRLLQGEVQVQNNQNRFLSKALTKNVLLQLKSMYEKTFTSGTKIHK